MGVDYIIVILVIVLLFVVHYTFKIIEKKNNW